MRSLDWGLQLPVRALTNAGAGFGAGYAIGGLVPGLVVGGILLGLGIVHGVALAIKRAYAWNSAGGWFLFIVDNTWSLLNSIAGSVYGLINFLMFNPLSDQGVGTGAVFHKRPFIPGFAATTVGNVVAGDNASTAEHELIHVLQGRIFGPLYIPLVILSYIVNTLLPYWLIYHDYRRAPINSVGAYFIEGVYRHTWNEEWAYKVAG